MGIGLSAVIVTKNEEKNIERCLSSLGFADEVVVVDAFSDDRTWELARSGGARVISRKWDGFASQKQFAIDQAKGDWILLVDADEEVTSELGREITEIARGSPRENGFRLRRQNQFLGRWIRYGPWASDFQVRLFRRAEGRIARRPVHEGVLVEGKLGTLKNPLNHFTHQTLSQSIERLNRYTTLEATDRVARRRIRLIDIAALPVEVFLRYYIIKGCWRGGVRGLLFASITAMYRAVLYLKIYFLQRETDASSTA